MTDTGKATPVPVRAATTVAGVYGAILIIMAIIAFIGGKGGAGGVALVLALAFLALFRELPKGGRSAMISTLVVAGLAVLLGVALLPDLFSALFYGAPGVLLVLLVTVPASARGYLSGRRAAGANAMTR
jgi:hypothetical protein